MAKTIILEYPDNTPVTRIFDDVDTVLRGVGGTVHSPTVVADDETDYGLAVIEHVQRQGRPAEAGTSGGVEIESNQLLITSGDNVLCGADIIQFTVVDGACTAYSIIGGA